MKNGILFLCLVLFLGSCKKLIENGQEDAVVKAMTTGQWKVTSFVKDGIDVTGDFSDYKFQFYKNGTVQAFKNGIVENTGTWTADADTYTINAQFNNASYPLLLLNATFLITDAADTYVVANTINGEPRALRLQKI